ncbi:MAG: tRNA-dihydrouridine synthase family protein [Candidatus Undinarchaeales archaeon]|nr:tRNA-dihydrouridine synthase family protein [Candidatus Undinarchaeales archaeon]MDP7494279.1 tRNA-dihydrouridine synthase family protein [Candidatus Undinarchaeales archaeon]
MPIPVYLAPMCNVTDIAYRQLCREHAGITTCLDMVSARGQLTRDETPPLLPDDGVQLLGGDPQYLVPAALQFPDAAFIDLNVGCSVRKVVRKGQGSALLKDLANLRRCVEALVDACPQPVTVKIRIGWDRETLEDTARALKGLDIARVTVHGRTAVQNFSEPADWGAIERAVGLFDVPVVGNGDVTSFERATWMMEGTGCDGVMVGRAAINDPLVLRDIEQGEDTCRTPEERITLFEEYAGLVERYGNVRFAQVRQHAVQLCRSMPGAAKKRMAILHSTDVEQVLAVLGEQRSPIQDKLE